MRHARLSDSVPASIREAEAAGRRALRVVPNNPSDSSIENGVGCHHVSIGVLADAWRALLLTNADDCGRTPFLGPKAHTLVRIAP